MFAFLLNIVCGLIATRISAQKVPSREINALNQLHSNTNGDSWLWENKRYGGIKWNFTRNETTGDFIENPCVSGWAGLNCSNSAEECLYQTCHITAVHLELYDLNGTIPSEIGDLIHLKMLSLTNNLRLSGSIPAEVGNLQALELLSLSITGLSGSIPSEIGYLTAQQHEWFPST